MELQVALCWKLEPAGSEQISFRYLQFSFKLHGEGKQETLSELRQGSVPEGGCGPVVESSDSSSFRNDEINLRWCSC